MPFSGGVVGTGDIYIYKDWFGEGYALGLMVGCSKRRWVSGGRDVRLLLRGAAAAAVG